MHTEQHEAVAIHTSEAWHDLVPRLLREHGSRRVVEVGVWQGDLSERILRECPQVEQLILVDPWRPVYGRLDSGAWAILGPGLNEREMTDAEAVTRYRMKPFGRRATILKLPSVEASRILTDGTLDAVLIDALHFEPHVSDDIRAWWPKLRRGGLMVGDDYGSFYPGVEIGVQAVFGERYKVLGQTWWVTNAHAA